MFPCFSAQKHIFKHFSYAVSGNSGSKTEVQECKKQTQPVENQTNTRNTGSNTGHRAGEQLRNAVEPTRSEGKNSDLHTQAD